MADVKVRFGEYKAKERLFVCIKKPTPYPNPFGECGYYRWRFENFLERHKDCWHLPPQYYFGPMQTKSDIPYIGNKVNDTKEWWSKVVNTEPLDPPYPEYDKGIPIVRESYGYKYCVVFTSYLTPKLSEDGKIWLSTAKFLLQRYMDEGLKKEIFTSKYNIKFNEKVATKTLKNVELDNAWFQDFAFATHPDAYLDAKLIDLSIADKIEISLTPDFKEWMDSATWEQAWYVGKEQIIRWKNDTSAYGKQKYIEAKRTYHKAKNKLGDVKNKIIQELENLFN